ncbi:LCP family protein [Candidatus Formimonas warabiya]|uniref:Cell envelope-related transcriptional attenuator domain-containing protein n=1 Tax=Formimonas warabiya TaxID=1761012 RepID=A0A3G1KU44_FORW1|nr:LCP family protein [Candidatus Formimonas warabiya]ATW25966.1 hypothetical protein DCMF_15330 [Candidatus Formimonas warabiya]
MSDSLEEQFWGNKRTQEDQQAETRAGERNVKFFLALLFCMAFFLWIGFQAAFFFPLETTEARPDQPEGTGAQTGPVKDDKQTILVIGSDRRKNEPARADTIILVFLDAKQKTVRILNIPRDTYVTIADKEIKTKINHAFAYGGMTMAKDTVERFLDIEVDHYVDTDFKGFASLIDALGGITLDVEKRMYTPEEGIDLQPGLQELDGEQALGYVRYRGDGLGDIGRVERQQKFLPILADKVMSLSTLWKIPKLAGIFRDNVETDISLKQLLLLANDFKNLDVSQIDTRMLPGKPEYINGVSYWITDPDEVAQMIDELENGTTPEEAEPEETEETQKEQ